MDVIQFYHDFGIPYKTEGHKHCKVGWVNIACPHCTGNPGWHMGFHLTHHYFRCRRCGWKPIVNTLALLANVDYDEAYILAKQYGSLYGYTKPIKEIKPNVSPFLLPPNLTELKTIHRNYLIGRNFNPDELIEIWDIKGIGPLSRVDDNDYKFRIFIPYYWGGTIISFDTRDVTGKKDVKYLACHKDREIIPHKEILYGRQEYWGSTGILVEGPTDAWRFGPQSCAASGIEYTDYQKMVLGRTFKRLFIVFDAGESAATYQARELKAELQSLYHTEVKQIDIQSGDPGSMSQSEADYLVKQLIGR